MMKQLSRLVLFGSLSWFVVFSASVCLFSLKQNGQERLFEMLMGFVLTTATVALTLLFFRNIASGSLRAGCLLGLAFLVCNLLFDLPLFSMGPMKMSPSTYLKDIGLSYLSMPVISIGMGFALRMRRPARLDAN